MIDDDDENVLPFPRKNVEDLPDELKAMLSDLARIKRTQPITYTQRRNRLARALGIRKGAIDEHVDLLIKADKTNTDPDNDEVIDDLFVVGKTKSTLWKNSDRVGYATFERDGHLENHCIKGEDYQDFLGDEYSKEHQREVKGELLPIYPKQAPIKEAISQLYSYARNHGEERKPRIRVNFVDGALWLDLGRSDWKGVRITEEGWTVKDKITAPLIRGQGMRDLPIPAAGGDINALRDFTNSRTDEEFVLFCGCTVGLFNTFGNYTTTIFCGPAGSAKTSACRVMRRLVDPNKVDTKPFSSARDLRHAAGSTHVIGLENISGISGEFSDEICRLNTGLSFSERLYYSQGREFQSNAHCPVLINGIPPDLAERDDLIDRTVTFSFSLLGDKLISDDVFWREFNGARPRLLGALLDGVVSALRVRQEFRGDNDAAGAKLLDGWRPRFIDFAVFAEAGCRAMGFEPGAFAEAYKNNQGYIIRCYAERDPICVGIHGLIAARGPFRSYPQDLYEAIKPYAQKCEEPLAASSSWLMRRLPRAIPALFKVHGIRVQTGVWLDDNGNNNGIIIPRCHW